MCLDKSFFHFFFVSSTDHQMPIIQPYAVVDVLLATSTAPIVYPLQQDTIITKQNLK